MNSLYYFLMCFLTSFRYSGTLLLKANKVCQSPPQKLKVGTRSRPYLLVMNKSILVIDLKPKINNKWQFTVCCEVQQSLVQ